MSQATDAFVLDRAPAVSPAADFALGLVLVAGLPAVFWCAVYALVAAMFGINVAPMSLLAVGCAIALFLSLVFGALVPRRA